jgi:5'-deoxynucleotidase YfbR-like HD superfamily hydrolase
MTPRKDETPRVWQRMLSGRRLDLLDPSPLDVEIDDIAHGLARVARWNGQTSGRHAFSVAQHTLLVDDIALVTSPGIGASGRMAIMLHDAPEYVIGDMITPFKALLGGEYKAVEERLRQAIHMRFGLPSVLPGSLAARIKAADRVAAYHEAVSLAGFTVAEADRYFGRPSGIDAAALDLDPWPAAQAERGFLKRFHQVAKAAADES